MRHRKFGKYLGRNTAHRRSLLRNLVTSLVLEERIETTVPKAKAARSLAEHLITLGKRGDLHARRLAARDLTTPRALKRLFDEVAKRYQSRAGGYTRIIRTGFRVGDGAEKAVLELVGTEVLQKRAEARAARAEKRKAALEASGQRPVEESPEKDKDAKKD